MPKNWAKGLTKDTDERVARAAWAHLGLKYKRRQIKRNNFAWSFELAYVVGLITTDGNLSKDGRHLEFTSKDKELVETFKSILHLNNKISKKGSGSTTGKKYSRIQFGNVQFYNWLVKIGLSPNKSRILGELLIPDEYFFDFLRGYLDGDGHLRSFPDKLWPNSLRVYIEFTSASSQNLFWIQNTLKRLLNIKGSIRKQASIFRLSFAKNDSLLLLSRMYYDSEMPHLKRKKQKADEILNENQAEVMKLENMQP